ncbi:hypothetical protein [Zhongshania arctica]|uniref:Uncharacterized protein n=1 Tax=Zhongshania arctica TaxID=3238302 RepID=A0ABV3TQL9_9GAMM
MKYWRMQLHPDEGKSSGFYSHQSVAAGFIGLDFATDTGDLLAEDHSEILSSQKDYVDFAQKMEVGDKVLVISHHFPLALVTVDSEYNYIRRTEPKIGVWFRHFRRIKDVVYYSDFKTNAKSWDQYIMTDTISILKDPNSKSYKLIERMSTVET